MALLLYKPRWLKNILTGSTYAQSTIDLAIPRDGETAYAGLMNELSFHTEVLSQSQVTAIYNGKDVEQKQQEAQPNNNERKR